MKKIFLVALLIIAVSVGIAAWIFLGSATGFSSSKEYLYIRSDAATKEAVLDSLEKNKIITNISAFNFLANKFNYWEKIRPGKYEIKKGSSLLSIVRMLRNGRQVAIDLVITKIRTKEDFARITGNKFQFDSTAMINFLNSSDSLKNFETDAEASMWNVVPDTYSFFWNVTPKQVYQRLYTNAKTFWNEERKSKAAALGLTTQQAYILASIVEEETTNNAEKDTIASVYLNRFRKGMPLQADPTLKFAVRDFSIKWIHGPIISTVSPYNTYKVKGLPPGPICTPSKKTIDEVLSAPQTPYYFFVANTKLNGHLFSTTFEEHVKKAQVYREEDKKRREAAAGK